MLFRTSALATIIACAGLLSAPSPGHAADAFPTTNASGVLVARTGTVDRAGRAVVDLAVVCPNSGTVDGLLLTFEQHRHGQVTQGFTDYESVAIPCSPEGTHIQLALEVFTDIYFGPGRIELTETVVCGLDGCRSFDLRASVILHRG